MTIQEAFEIIKDESGVINKALSIVENVVNMDEI